MARQIGSIVPTILISHLVAIGIAGMIGTSARAADECLRAPNGPSAKGHHWFYRIDRATQRKCWYQRGHDAAAAAPRPARPAPPQKQQVAEVVPRVAPAAEPVERQTAFAPAAAPAPMWPEVVPPGDRREAALSAVQRSDPAGSTQTVNRQELGVSIATRQAAAAPNDIRVQSAPDVRVPNVADGRTQNTTRLAAVASAVPAAPAVVPVSESATFTPFRILLLLLFIGIIIIPGILLRLIFKFGVSTRKRIQADRADRKNWRDNVERNWAPSAFDAAAAPPLAPRSPVIQPIDPEQLLRKILRELEHNAAKAMPDAAHGGSRR
jgi:hypothetical protein